MRLLIFVLLLAISASAVAVAPESWTALRLERAMTNYEAGDYRKAIKDFHRLADHGSAIAETMLGVIYADGKGVRPHSAVAAGYFLRAANRGYGPAQIALSDAFLTGRGVTPSAEDAYFWAMAATVGGDRSAERQGRARIARLRKSLSAATVAGVEERLHDWRPRAVRTR